jgi:ADP-heptose:LPS heptosyltransferase
LHPDFGVRKVLVYRLGSLGDTIVSLPSLHLIERAFPNSERILLTNFPVHAKAPAAAGVLGDSGLIHGYMRYSVGTRSPRDLFRLASQIRRFQPDILVYLMSTRSPRLVLRDKWFFRWAAGVRRIVGLPREDQQERTFDPNTGLYEAEAMRLARGISDIGDAAPDDLRNWDLRLTETERQTARAALGALTGKSLVVCGPGTKMQAKDWGPENWRALVARISARYPQYGLVMIGAKEDADVAAYALHGWSSEKVNLCGILSPRETAAVLEYASLFLGPDSGPMHLAACAGVPCVIAFSARGLPGVWYPFGQQHRILYHRVSCAGCNLETCIAEARRCLTSITVDEMTAAADEVLSNSRHAQPLKEFRTLP